MKQSPERVGPKHSRFLQGNGWNLTEHQKTPEGKVSGTDKLLFLFIHELIRLLIHSENMYFSFTTL